MTVSRKPLALAAWLCLAGVPWTTALPALRDPNAVKDSYDYVIVGGGLTGLVVANRLTENPKSELAPVETAGMVSHTSSNRPRG